MFAKQCILRLFWLVGLVALASPLSLAADSPPDVAGQIISIDGTPEVAIINPERGGTRPAHGKDVIYVGDKLVTLEDQTVTIELDEKTEILIAPSSNFRIDIFDAKTSQQTLLSLAYGKLRTLVRKVYDHDDTFVIKTPASVMGVRGTEFIIESDRTNRETRIFTLKGKVAVAKDLDTLTRFFRDGAFASRVKFIEAGHSSQLRPSTTQIPPPVAFDQAKLRERLRMEAPKLEPFLDTPGAKDAKPLPNDRNERANQREQEARNRLLNQKIDSLVQQGATATSLGPHSKAPPIRNRKQRFYEMIRSGTPGTLAAPGQ